MAGGAMHEELDRTDEAHGGSDRAFGLTFAVVCGLIGAYTLYRGGGSAPWWGAAAVAFLVVALARPMLLAPLNRVWTRFGLLLHRIVSPLVMAILFFGTMLPIGLLLRLRGKDLLRTHIDRQSASYWIPRDPPGPAPGTMPRQF